MNKGISLSSGHYIIFMNAGDVFFDDSVLSDFENFIESCTSFPAMVYGHTHVKLSDGSFFKRKVRSLDYIWHGQPTIHQSVFFNREVHSQNLYAFEKYPVSSDYAVMASIQRANGDNIKVWDRTVSVFDNDPGSFGNRQLLQRVRDAWNVQRDINRSPILARIVSVGKRLAANVFYNFRRNAR